MENINFTIKHFLLKLKSFFERKRLKVKEKGGIHILSKLIPNFHEKLPNYIFFNPIFNYFFII